MQDSFEEAQPKWVRKSSRNDYYGHHDSQNCTTEDEDSEDENQEYVLFEGNSQSKIFGLPDIDLMDLPISGSSVALPNCMKLPISKQSKLMVKKFEKSQLIRKECSFCQERLYFNCKVVELPCHHLIHYSCIEKWNLITHPCRICDI